MISLREDHTHDVITGRNVRRKKIVPTSAVILSATESDLEYDEYDLL